MKRALVVALLAVAGCTPEMGEYVPRHRDYQPSVTFPEESERPLDGGLWTPTRGGNFLFADQRAMRTGDIVTVLVQETADARRGASTNLDRQSQMSNAITDFLAVFKLLKPGMSGAELLGGKSTSEFKGQGETTRTENLSAKVQATVKRVLPNGYLFIEGHRVILVNREEHHFYISGVIRREDIADDNSVASSRIAEAEIEFTGRGVISDKQGPGVLQRAMDQYGPF